MCFSFFFPIFFTPLLLFAVYISLYIMLYLNYTLEVHISFLFYSQYLFINQDSEPINFNNLGRWIWDWGVLIGGFGRDWIEGFWKCWWEFLVWAPLDLRPKNKKRHSINLIVRDFILIFQLKLEKLRTSASLTPLCMPFSGVSMSVNCKLVSVADCMRLNEWNSLVKNFNLSHGHILNIDWTCDKISYELVIRLGKVIWFSNHWTKHLCLSSCRNYV